MISGKTIFISPIDWGLGHATRCVPLIKSLSENNKIIIGVTELNRAFFKEYFLKIRLEELPSYKISYSKKLPVWLMLLFQSPRFFSVIKKEKIIAEKIISEHKIDFIISDNRFGLRNKNVHSVFLSHQLNLKAPFFSFLANLINKNYIHKFNEVWVPDFENVNLRLSGELSDSDGIRIPTKYIGPLSAVATLPENETYSEQFDYLILLSGVEPQRTILETSLIQKFEKSDKKIIFVRGSNSTVLTKNKTIQFVNFSFGIELTKLIVNSKTVICRSGYSTLMDLHLLNKKNIILIPTPGQTEQEYLADYWRKKFNAFVVKQNAIKNYHIR